MSHIVQIAPGETITLTVTATACDAPPPVAPPASAPWEDVIAAFPTNPNAQNPASSPGRWATGNPGGITIHHTGTHNPMALANYCLSKAYVVGGVRREGLPTTQYHIFIHADGRALLCVPLNLRLWHDHGGYPNSNISIGMAGFWHQTTPPTVMLNSLARVVAYLMGEYGIPLGHVTGHRERALASRPPWNVQCPGWSPPPIGSGWKPLFDQALALALDGVA